MSLALLALAVLGQSARVAIHTQCPPCPACGETSDALMVLVEKYGLQGALLAKTDPKMAKTKPKCCCKEGRCEANELGADWSRARETSSGRCCKLVAPEMTFGISRCPGRSKYVWRKGSSEDCIINKEQQLAEFVGKVGPNPYEKVSAEQCHNELDTFFKGIQEYGESRDLHGHWIREMHSKQWAEAFEYQLFIEGAPFGPGTLGADLFSMSQPVKLLWSGVDPATRDAWKKSLKAGELAKETKAGQSLEKAGDGMKSCNFLDIILFWEAASGSLLSVDQEKPLVVLLKKTLEQLDSTAFWRAEVPALALHPPSSTILVVTMLEPCSKIYEKLADRIKAVVDTNIGATRRWEEQETKIRCMESKSPPSFWQRFSKLGKMFPPPLLDAKGMTRAGFSAQVLRELDLSPKWLKERGFDASELRDGGFTTKELSAAGFTAWELYDVLRKNAFEKITDGFGRGALKDAAYRSIAKEFYNAGFQAGELLDLGLDLFLRDAGFTLTDLYDAGMGAQQLQNAGFTSRQLYDAGIISKKQYRAGFMYITGS